MKCALYATALVRPWRVGGREKHRDRDGLCDSRPDRSALLSVDEFVRQDRQRRGGEDHGDQKDRGVDVVQEIDHFLNSLLGGLFCRLR